MARPKLEPCPFCGETAVTHQIDAPQGASYMPGCTNPDCPANPWYIPPASEEEAAMGWNRRAGAKP